MLILWRAFTVYSTLSVISSSMSGRNCNWTRNLMKRIKVETMSKKVWMEFQKRIVDTIRLDAKGEKQIIKQK